MPAQTTGLRITGVTFSPVTLTAGNQLTVSITVKNTRKRDTFNTQDPLPGTIYIEGTTCGVTGVPNAIRVGVDFQDNTGTGYPYRWGLGRSLGPGEVVTVVGSITLKTSGIKTYWAGLIQEVDTILLDKVQTTSITVTAPNPITVIVAPVTRVEGHLKVEAELGSGEVFGVKSSGTMFRGLETILQGRDPRHAALLTQRICGVCPIPHATAATKALENAALFTPPAKARLMRNLVLGANFLQSHIFSFYQLSLLDYVQGPAMPPWTGGYSADYRLSVEENATYVDHHVKAMAINRKCQEIGAILAGKLPHAPGFVAGGMTATPSMGELERFETVLDNEIVPFLSVYRSDVEYLSTAYSDYRSIGVGPGNYLCFGGFDLGDETQLFQSGLFNGDSGAEELDQNRIAEFVQRSWYAASGSQHPSAGSTAPSPGKPGAYSWVKAPRYYGKVYEVGPLARMMVNSILYPDLELQTMNSVMGRHLARAREAQVIANAMVSWLVELKSRIGESNISPVTVPTSGSGAGLTEAPRGALGHWLNIDNSRVTNYQVITPTTWNASPADDSGQSGAMEQALIGTAVANPVEPIELTRIIHSFDPCLACAVHVVDLKSHGKEEARFSAAAPSRK